jgi:hypothetical protein
MFDERAFIRNFQQLGTLFDGERSHKMDISFNPIKHTTLVSQPTQSVAWIFE